MGVLRKHDRESLDEVVDHDHQPFNVFSQLNNKRLVDELVRRFGWFSHEHAEWSGSAIWRTPEGKSIQITAVLSREAGTGYTWKDAVLVGEVVECVRVVDGGKLQQLRLGDFKR
jgi:hypothetical protein